MLSNLWEFLVKKYNDYFERDEPIGTNMNRMIYNSRTDSVELLIYNFNLTNITLDTHHLNNPYGACLQACFKQRHLKTLTIITEYDATTMLQNIDAAPLNELKFVHLTTNRFRDHNIDHINPIIKNAKNLETIIYENGYLSEHSMQLITGLEKLDLLILDNILIPDYRSYSIMLFNIRIKTLVVRVKYAFPQFN